MLIGLDAFSRKPTSPDRDQTRRFKSFLLSRLPGDPVLIENNILLDFCLGAEMLWLIEG